MSSVWVSTAVLGFLQLAVVLAMLWEVRTTREAYLEGRILVRLHPRESSGFVNLRIENVGMGPVEDVKIMFPQGFPAIPERQEQIDLSSRIPKCLGTFGPHEFREWNVGFLADRYQSSLPDTIPYVLEYRVSRPLLTQWIPFLRGRRRFEGELCFSGYKRVLLNPYVGLEDLHRQIHSLVSALEKIQGILEMSQRNLAESAQRRCVEASDASDG